MPVLSLAIEMLMKLRSPVTPHLCEEHSVVMGQNENTDHSIQLDPCPTVDKQALTADVLEIVIQVNGKLRDRFEATPTTPKEELEKRALASKKIKAHTDGKTIVKVIVVPGKLVNIVVK